MPELEKLTGGDLAEIQIGVNLRKFTDIVWETADYITEFLIEKLYEKEIVVTEWTLISSPDDERVKYERTIDSQHPLPISLPWLPLFVQSSNVQCLEYDSQHNNLRIVETSVIKGLPFVEPCIITEWDVHELPTSSCLARITLRHSYDKSSWIQGMIESNSRTELIRFFQMWETNFNRIAVLSKVDSASEISQSVSKLAFPFPGRSTLECNPTTKREEIPLNVKLESSAIDFTRPLITKSALSIDPKLIALIDFPEKIISAQEFSLNPVAEKIVSPYGSESEISSNASYKESCGSFDSILSGLQENNFLKIIAATLISISVKFDVAGFHGIEVNDFARVFLNQTASISLIFCLVLTLEFLVRMIPLLMSTILSWDLTDFLDVIYDFSLERFHSNMGLRLIRDALLTLLPPPPTVTYNSIGTQTDAETICHAYGNVNVTSSSKDTSESASLLLEGESCKFIRNVGSVDADNASWTWRDCQTPIPIGKGPQNLVP